MEKISTFEKDVLLKILSGDTLVLELLRIQLNQIVHVERTFTGVGFFLEVSISNHECVTRVDRLPNVKKDFGLYDLCGFLNDDRIDVGFNLFIRDGLIKTLEGFVFDDELWPDTIHSYEIFFCSNISRDLNEISKEWNKNC